jgi:hypothetical protein
MKDQEKKRRKDEPISLAPLDFKEALADLLAVEPEKGEPEDIDETDDMNPP